MTESLVRLAAACMLGFGACTGALLLLGFLPLDSTVKKLLGFVIPVPTVAMALVMVYCWPGFLSDTLGIDPGSRKAARLLITGAALAIASYAASFLWHRTHRDLEEGDDG